MYYARVLRSIPVCIGFEDKKLRDEWVAKQNMIDEMIHEGFLESLNISEKDLPWEERYKAITAEDAMKIFGERDAWGDRKIHVHRVIHSINDLW